MNTPATARRPKSKFRKFWTLRLYYLEACCKVMVSRSTHPKHNKVQPHLSIINPLLPRLPPIPLCHPPPCHHDLAHSSNSLTQLPHQNRIFMTCQDLKSNDRTRLPMNWTSSRTPKVDRLTDIGTDVNLLDSPRMPRTVLVGSLARFTDRGQSWQLGNILLFFLAKVEDLGSPRPARLLKGLQQGCMRNWRGRSRSNEG